MKIFIFVPIFIVFLFTSQKSFAAPELLYDAEKNGIDLYGPYLKYNFLEPPYSFGLSAFKKTDIGMKESEGLQAFWPEYFLDSGTFAIFDYKSQEVRSWDVSREDLKLVDDSFLFSIPGGSAVLDGLEKGFHFCVLQENLGYRIRICSDKMSKSPQGLFQPLRTTKDVVVLVNDVKVPTNAQIVIGKEDEDVSLVVKFRSGMRLSIKENVYRVTKDQLVVNSTTGHFAIQHKELIKAPSEVSFFRKVKKAFSEKNLLKDQQKAIRHKSQAIPQGDFELSPFRGGRSLQIFGLSVGNIAASAPPVKIVTGSSIGTYSDSVTLMGQKQPGAIVQSPEADGVLPGAGENQFLWNFKAPVKGEFNKDELQVRTGESSEAISYSARVYRGYRGSIAARAAATSGLKSLVPGIQIQGDYWFEKVFSDSPYLFQRWGISAGYSKALSDFEAGSFGNELDQSSAFVDLMYRFSPGVRPMESSFGAGLRFFDFNILGGDIGDVDPTLLGAGVFWHTAPIGLIDGAVSAIPFFNKPKWMELAAYVYPVSLTEDLNVSLAFSIHARGRLMFSKRWFVDGTLNLHSIGFQRTNFEGTASVVEGALGIGLNF